MSSIRLSYFFNITAVKELVIIDNYDSFTYNLVHYFDALDCNVTVYRNDEINFNQINEFPRIVSPILGIRDARYAVSATNTPNITTFPMLLFSVRPNYAFSKSKTAIKSTLASLNNCVSFFSPVVERKTLNW